MNSPNSGRHGGRGDEFAAIDALRRRFESAARSRDPAGAVPPAGEVWIGDDAAVLAVDGGSPAVWATDLVVGGVHVDPDLCSPEDVGFKALMVAASDLAAMGARPRSALVSLAAPEGTDIDGLGRGLAEASVEAGCVVVGGDLAGSPTLVVSVSVLGDLTEPATGALLRSGARPGDHLLVSGPLGRSAAGLRLLRAGERRRGDAVHADLLAAYRRPVARIAEGEAARLNGARAAIDISDGLVADVRHLGRASGVGVAVDEVPVAQGATTDEALSGGEDYELILATPDPERLIEAFLSARLPAPLPVGRCTDRPGEYTYGGGPLPEGGWRHRF